MTLPGERPLMRPADPQVIEQVEIQAKYQGYIERQQDEVAKQPGERKRAFPWASISATIIGLSKEVQQKLAQHKPQTLGQASRIQGVTPAAISILLVCLKRRQSDRPDRRLVGLAS
jgi:tRNA uridine 5-carboxymethylaminomethyl modification enzyme